jgi:hypothetical protein
MSLLFPHLPTSLDSIRRQIGAAVPLDEVSVVEDLEEFPLLSQRFERIDPKSAIGSPGSCAPASPIENPQYHER